MSDNIKIVIVDENGHENTIIVDKDGNDKTITINKEGNVNIRTNTKYILPDLPQSPEVPKILEKPTYVENFRPKTISLDGVDIRIVDKFGNEASETEMMRLRDYLPDCSGLKTGTYVVQKDENGKLIYSEVGEEIFEKLSKVKFEPKERIRRESLDKNNPLSPLYVKIAVKNKEADVTKPRSLNQEELFEKLYELGKKSLKNKEI